MDGLSAPSDEVIDNGYNADKDDEEDEDDEDDEEEEEEVKPVTIPSRLLRPGADASTLVPLKGMLQQLPDSGLYCDLYKYYVGEKAYYAIYVWSIDENKTILMDSLTNCYSAYRSQITDIILADYLTDVAVSYAFSGYTGVTYVHLPTKLNSLRQHDFYNCTSLKEITIPGSLKSSQGYTFHNCSSLETVTFGEGITTIPNNFMRADTGGDTCSVKTVVFPSTLKMIGTQAFMDMYYLENVTFSKPAATKLTYIGPQAFYNTNLSSLSLPKFAGTWVDEETYINPRQMSATIEAQAFAGIRNTDFKELRIPEGVKVLKQIYDSNSHFVDI